MNDYLQAPYDAGVVAAMQALRDGVANEDQQYLAMKWIIEVAGFAYQQSFHPGGEDGRRATDFSEGRRFVANSIIKMMKIPLSVVQAQDEARKNEAI